MGLQNEVIILKSRPIAMRVLETLDFQVEYFQEGSFTNTEIYLNNPVVVEVDWKFPQTIDGLIKVVWLDDKSFTLEFIDENYTKLLPDGSKVGFGFQPEPIKGAFNEWIETNELKINIHKVTPDPKGSILIKLRDLNSLANSYSASLEVEPVERGASIMQLNLVCSNLNKGQLYLNTLMNSVLEMELEQKKYLC
ncbi:hypothetical protein [Algoriphagus boritolerans]|uniref:hypothetical protein n=1 Tax=Algoriphagus boritolerans TaxID=308111 RepID=UPI002FCDFD82